MSAEETHKIAKKLASVLHQQESNALAHLYFRLIDEPSFLNESLRSLTVEIGGGVCSVEVSKESARDKAELFIRNLLVLAYDVDDAERP